MSIEKNLNILLNCALGWALKTNGMAERMLGGKATKKYINIPESDYTDRFWIKRIPSYQRPGHNER